MSWKQQDLQNSMDENTSNTRDYSTRESRLKIPSMKGESRLGRLIVGAILFLFTLQIMVVLSSFI